MSADGTGLLVLLLIKLPLFRLDLESYLSKCMDKWACHIRHNKNH